MISIEAKIILTSLIVTISVILSASPDTPFSEWGKRKFKSYDHFLDLITAITISPAVIAGLIWL
jgi:hypothetical protein